MNRFRAMLINHFLEQLRQVNRNMLLFFIPVVIFFAFYLFFSINKVELSFLNPLNVGVIDEDQTLYSQMLINDFKGKENFSKYMKITTGTQEEIHKGFNEGVYDGIIDIPKGFVDSLLYFEYKPLRITISYRDPVKATIFGNGIMGYENYITSVETGVNLLYDSLEAAGLDAKTLKSYNKMASYDLINTVLSRNEMFEYNELIRIPSTSSIKYIFVAIAIMFLMYISVFAALHLIREKEDHCFERLQLSSQSIFSYLFSKALSNSVFISCIFLLWYVLLILFAKSRFEYNELGILAFLFVCTLFSVCFAIFISAFSHKEENMMLMSTIFIFANAIFGGSIIPIHYMPVVLQKLGMASPNFWMIKGILLLDNQYEIQSWIGILIGLLVASIGMVYISAIQYKKVR